MTDTRYGARQTLNPSTYLVSSSETLLAPPTIVFLSLPRLCPDLPFLLLSGKHQGRILEFIRGSFHFLNRFNFLNRKVTEMPWPAIALPPCAQRPGPGAQAIHGPQKPPYLPCAALHAAGSTGLHNKHGVALYKHDLIRARNNTPPKLLKSVVLDQVHRRAGRAGRTPCRARMSSGCAAGSSRSWAIRPRGRSCAQYPTPGQYIRTPPLNGTVFSARIRI